MLNCKDVFSKKIWLRGLKTKKIGTEENPDEDSIINAVQDIFISNGGRKPHRIQTDRGKEFEGKFSAWLLTQRVKHIRSAAYKPTSQGQVERSNRTVKELLRKYFLLYDTKNWKKALQQVEENINDSRHNLTQVKPFSIFSNNFSFPHT